MPKPKFNKRTLQSLEQLAGLRQQLADQEFEALKAAQEAAAVRQQTAGEAAARASNILNNAKGVRQASTGRMHFTRSKSGSGIYTPVTSSGQISVPQTSSVEPVLAAKEIQTPMMPTTRVRVRSSKNPFVNMTQSMQNAYDAGLPGLQSMFASDLNFRMGAPLMTQLVDRTGRTAQSISKQINPETGAIYTNYFDVVEPNYAQWRKLHSMIKGSKPTAEEAKTMFQTPQMKTIFSRMQNLLGIEPLEAKQINIRKPYLPPSMTVKSRYVAPNTSITDNPDYLAHQAALKDMESVGINVDERLIPYDGVLGPGGIPVAFNSYPRRYTTSPHFSTQGFTTRGHMFAEDLDSGLGSLEIDSYSEPYSKIAETERKLNWYSKELENMHTDNYRYNNYRWEIQNLQNELNKLKDSFKFKQGGVVSAKSGIHIKKKNRGKFTSWCGGKVTSACIARGKASSNPTIRKRATFAANARKWKH